jgi:hypothetical protein
MRLESFVSQYPSHQEALELLGEVLFRMGDLPRAGRYWFMTARNDEEAQLAVAALRSIYPRPEHLLAALRVREEPVGYPPAAIERFEKVVAEAQLRGFHWAPLPDGGSVVLAPVRRRWWHTLLAAVFTLVVVAIFVAGTIRLVEIALDLVR